jgi:hypothetical protein
MEEHIYLHDAECTFDRLKYERFPLVPNTFDRIENMAGSIRAAISILQDYPHALDMENHLEEVRLYAHLRTARRAFRMLRRKTLGNPGEPALPLLCDYVYKPDLERRVDVLETVVTTNLTAIMTNLAGTPKYFFALDPARKGTDGDEVEMEEKFHHTVDAAKQAVRVCPDEDRFGSRPAP